MIRCPVCDDDGWVALPQWADHLKQLIKIKKIACPRGCPLKDPTEAGVLPWPPPEAEPQETKQ